MMNSERQKISLQTKIETNSLNVLMEVNAEGSSWSGAIEASCGAAFPGSASAALAIAAPAPSANGGRWESCAPRATLVPRGDLRVEAAGRRYSASPWRLAPRAIREASEGASKRL